MLILSPAEKRQLGFSRVVESLPFSYICVRVSVRGVVCRYNYALSSRVLFLSESACPHVVSLADITTHCPCVFGSEVNAVVRGVANLLRTNYFQQIYI